MIITSEKKEDDILNPRGSHTVLRKNDRDNVRYCLETLPQVNSKQFLAQLGINRSTITRWKQGMIPRESNVINFAHAIQLPRDWFKLSKSEFVKRLQESGR